MALIPRAMLSLLSVIGGAAGCAGPEPPQVAYLPPTGLPAQVSDARVPQSSDVVWAQLLDELKRSPLTIERADRATGVIVATYVGAPEEHVDCGWIVQATPEGLSKTPGARQEVVVNGADGSPTTRTLRLNARTMIQVQPAGLDTLVSANSVYVLAKIAGTQGAADYEVVSFRTGGKGKFASGTLCQPTAKLEHLALDSLPTSSIAASTPGATRSITPIDERLDCAGVDSAYCQALEITAPYREANAQQQLGFKVEAYGSGRGVLHEADLLTLDISFPSFDSYLHVAYIERNGRVGQVMSGDTPLWPARAANYVQETGYEIAQPFGIEMIVAVATDRPLFATPRPQFEPGASYLEALRRSLDKLQAENPETRIAVDAIFVQTEPRGPPASAALPGSPDLPTDS